MQQSCQQCGFLSPTSARFCRQCGSTLFAETELTAAATRNYGRQEPSVAAPASGHLPPSVGDAIAGETERYYQPPPWSPVPPTPNTAPIRSKVNSRMWLVMLLILLISVAGGAYLTGKNVGRRTSAPPVEFSAEDEARQRQEEQQREMEDRIREAQERAREAQERQREALDRARDAAEQAGEAGAAVALSGEKLLDLTPYEYPGATVGSSIRIPGHEILSQRTSDGFDAVLQFYQKKLGKPIIHTNETWEKRLLFQSAGPPAVSVSVETDFEHGGQLKIVVLRSPFGNIKPDGEAPR
ncbi:MAG: hypothetical protein ACREEM_40940 [Blastocatellia bacterium]